MWSAKVWYCLLTTCPRPGVPHGEHLQPNPLSPRRERRFHCHGVFTDESLVVGCRECQVSLHRNCLRPHWQLRHANLRFSSDDEQDKARTVDVMTVEKNPAASSPGPLARV